jgi:hypothetical protein
MCEHRSLSESRSELSAEDRLTLIQTLNLLPSTQFDNLVFALKPPNGNMPGSNAPQGKRSKALLEWVESPVGPGLTKLEKFLDGLTSNEEFIVVTIEGKFSETKIADLHKMIEELRRMTDDNSINVKFISEGSIKIILSGSPEGLKKLEELFESSELENSTIAPIQMIERVQNDTSDVRKARLIQTLRRYSKSSLLVNARARVRDLDFVLTFTRALTYALDNARALIRALARDLDFDLDFDLARDLDHALDLARDLARDLDSTVDFALDLARNLALKSTVAHDDVFAIDSNIARDLAHAIARVRVIDRVIDRLIYFSRAINNARTLDLTRNLNNVRTITRRGTIFNLSSCNLRGANLRNIYLKGADLTGTDLTGADLTGTDLTDANLIGADLINTNFTNTDVTRTLFGRNIGLLQSDKLDLERRGAIFQDPPSSDVPSLVLR